MAKSKAKDKVESTVKVQRYVYEKVLKDDAEVFIPQEPIYYKDGHSTLIALIPQLATWDNNDVWELQIIEIRGNRIMKAFVRTDANNLSDIISRFDVKGKSGDDHLVDEVVQYLLDYPNEDRVSRETFMNAYDYQVGEFNKLLEIL